MNVDQRATNRIQERRGQYLHAARQNPQIHVAAKQQKLTLFGLGADVAGGRDVDERHSEWTDVLGQLGMVGDHHHGDISSSPQRLRHNRSSKQWSSLDAMVATKRATNNAARASKTRLSQVVSFRETHCAQEQFDEISA